MLTKIGIAIYVPIMCILLWIEAKFNDSIPNLIRIGKEYDKLEALIDKHFKK